MRLTRLTQLTTSVLAVIVVFAAPSAVRAQTPALSTNVPAASFAGEQFCFDAGLTNTGAPGFAPYVRLVLAPGLHLDSSTFLTLGTSVLSVGTFSAPDDTLADPETGTVIAGPDGGTLSLIELPVSSVVEGEPTLVVNICVTIDAAAEIGVPLEVTATPVFVLGDTASGDNGPIEGIAVTSTVTPTIVIFSKSDDAPEAERPTGPSFPVTYTLNADIANAQTVSNLQIGDVLPASMQFDGPISIAGGVGCAAVASPSMTTPGGVLTVTCAAATGTTGSSDVVVRYAAHVIDVLDHGSCDSEQEINAATLDGQRNNPAAPPPLLDLPQSSDTRTVTAHHVTLHEGVSPGLASPGETVTFTLTFLVSDYVSTSALVVRDLLPDGLIFATHAGMVVNGSPVSISPATSTDGSGVTTIVYDVGAVTGSLPPGTTGTITYTATVSQSYTSPPEPVRAADRMGTSSLATYSLTSGAAGCTNPSGATVTIRPVTASKIILNPQPEYFPGDVVTFRLQLSIPSGDSRDIVFEDFFPLPVFRAATIDITGAPNLPTPDLRLAPTDTLGLTPIAVSTDAATNALRIEWPDVVTTAPQVIAVDVDARVTDEPFADRLSFANILQTSTKNTPGTAAAATAPEPFKVRAPDLFITSGVIATDGDGTISPAAPADPATETADGDLSGADGGDQVSYMITVENRGGAPAYDVSVTDPPVAGLTNCSVASVRNGSGTSLAHSGDLVSGLVLGAALPRNDDNPVGGGPPYGDGTALITVTCDLDTTVTPGQVVTTTATVDWSSQSGATQFVPRSDTASVAAATPQLDLAVVSTSEASTSSARFDPAVADLTIGEEVTFYLTATLNEGTTPRVVLTDLLPSSAAGVLDLVSASVVSVGANLTVANAPPVLTTTSGSAAFDFGQVIDTPDGVTDAGDQIVIAVVARVANDPRNAGGDRLADSGQLDYGSGSASASADVELVEPVLSVSKSASTASGDAGDGITFTVRVQHAAASSADAFDVRISDPLPAGMVFTGGLANGTGATVAATSLSESGGVITAIWDSLPVGGVGELTFQVALTGAVVPKQVITNTAALAWDSLPADGDPNERVGSGSASASVTVAQPSISNTIFSTSESSTGTAVNGPETDLTIGERVTYRVPVTFTEGTTPAARVREQLPTGSVALHILSSRIVSIGANISGAALPAIGVAGTATDNNADGYLDRVEWSLGDVLDAADGVSDANDQIVFEIVAVVADAPANAGGDNNAAATATLFYPGGSRAANVSVDLVEPFLTVVKTASPGNGDAGDTITFTVRVTHTGASTADAFDVQITDALPAHMTFAGNLADTAAATASSTSLSQSAGTVTATWASLPRGAVAEFSFDVTIDVTAQSGTSITNTADLRWDSLPSTSSPDTYQRAGTASGSVQVQIASPTMSKSVVATSVAATGNSQFNPLLDDLTIGEEVTFHITATLPEGTTPLIIRDSLPFAPGVLEVVSASEVSIGARLTPSNSPAVIAVSDVNLGDGLDDTVTFDFGDVVNAPDMVTDAGDQIVVEVVARVVDVPANQSGDQLTNSALLQFGPGLNASATASVDVVAPLLTVNTTGDVTTGDAGDVVTFTVRVDHAGLSTADAFDVQVTDAIPPGMSFVPGSLVDTGTVAPAQLSESGGTITALWDTVARGAVAEFQFQATILSTVTPSSTITDTADLRWDSLPADGDPNERVGTGSDDHQIVITAPGLQKSVTATSEPSTGNSLFGPEPDLTIGETATYQFAVTLPEGTTPSASVVDQLPTGTAVLSVVSSRLVSIGANLSGAGLPALGAPGTSTDTDSDGVADRVAWSIGQVVNTPDGVSDAGDQLVFEVVAVVLDKSVNKSGVDDLVNTATLTYGGGTSSGTALVDLVEPFLSVAKTAVPEPLLADAGDQVTFRIVLAHTAQSTADAMSVRITDALPSPGLSWISDATVVSDCAGLTVDSSAAPNIVYSVPTLTLAASTCSIEYTARVDDTVAPSQTYTGTATMTYDSLPVFTAGETRRRSDSASASVTILAPGLTKLTTGSSLADTGSSQHDPALLDLTIGETVDYTITVVFPEGVADGAVVTDTMPADPASGFIEPVAASIVSIGANITTTAPGTPVLADDLLGDGRDDTVVFDFGTVTNTPDGVDDGKDRITLRVTGRVVDLPANADGDTLVNQAVLDYSGGTPLADSAAIDVVAPRLTLSKSMGAVTDDLVTVTVALSNSGTAPAYDLRLEDVLDDSIWDTASIAPVSVPSGFVFTAGAGPGAGQTTVSVASDPGSSLPASSIEPGETETFRFTVPVRGGSTPSTPVSNTVVNTAATTLPGVDANERSVPAADSRALLDLPQLDATKAAVLAVDADGSGSVSPGDTLRYTVTVTNSGTGAATAVVVRDGLDPHTALAVGSVTPPAAVITGNTAGDASIEVRFASLAAGTSQSVTYDVVIDDPLAAGVDTLVNQAVVESTELPDVVTDDPGTPAADDPTIVPVVAAPDLQIFVDDGGVTATPGGGVAYALTYANAGNQDAEGVVVTETVPAHASFDPASSTAGWSCTPDSTAGSICTLSIGSLAGAGSGGAAVFAVIVDAAPLAAGVDQLDDGASIADDGANGADANPADNSDSDTTPIDAAPDLRLIKTSDHTDAGPGDRIDFALSYANHGTQDATGVQIGETVPANTTFSAAGSTGGWSCPSGTGAGSACTFSVGNLGGNATGSVIFAVTVDSPVAAAGEQVSNLASVADDGTNGVDPNPADNSDTAGSSITAAPDLQISKQADRSNVHPNESLVYTLTYANAGNQSSSGVTVTETVPAHTTFAAAASAAGWTCTPGPGAGSTCRLSLGTVVAGAPPATALFAVVVDASVPAAVETIDNTVSIADDGTSGADANPGDNSASVSTIFDQCGNGVVETGEQCDAGSNNSDTVPGACRTTCVLPHCGDGIIDPTVADVVLMVDTSRSMRTEVSNLVHDLGSLPEELQRAGVDERLALVRFGTGRYSGGVEYPSVVTDFTTAGEAFRGALTELDSPVTGETESGTEAIDFAFDNLSFRPDAQKVFILYTDENDDLPMSIANDTPDREPPPNWISVPSLAAPFQVRLDEAAQRLIDNQVILNLIVNALTAPTNFQYGSSDASQYRPDGTLDVAATLDALRAKRMDRSIQGQLLGAGRCDSGVCTAGRVGRSCSADIECGLIARVFPEQIVTGAARNDFFRGLVAEIKGQIGRPEECDDGNLVNGDGCESNCALTGCGNGIVDPGEECDDGNADDGDACASDCTLTAVDNEVLSHSPMRIVISKGQSSFFKRLPLRVRNDNAPSFDFRANEKISRTVQLVADEGDCPAGTLADVPSFNPRSSGEDTVEITGGKTAVAFVPLYFSAATFTTVNKNVPVRCVLSFTAVDPDGRPDATPGNNVLRLELDVYDRNDSPQPSPQETFISPVHAVRLRIRSGAAGADKTVHIKVGNGDLLPVPEKPGHLITVTVDNGTCPAGTVSAADFGRAAAGPANSVVVRGGRHARATLAVHADSAAFSSTSPRRPARCVATITASGPLGDLVPSNDSVELVIEVVDDND